MKLSYQYRIPDYTVREVKFGNNHGLVIHQTTSNHDSIFILEICGILAFDC